MNKTICPYGASILVWEIDHKPIIKYVYCQVAIFAIKRIKQGKELENAERSTTLV